MVADAGESNSCDDGPIFCARCTVELTPGRGDFFVVRIEAVADPTPPNIAGEDLNRDHQQEIDRLLDQMRQLSAQEALDQVCRRLILTLCGPCYREWIEDPTGGEQGRPSR